MRLMPPIIKLTILCVVAGLIWHFSHLPSKTMSAHDLEELAEQTEPEVAVHVGKISTMTLHRYLTVFGTVEPAPARDGKPAAMARISSATRGIVAEVDCTEGQQVEKNQPLFALDTRQADAAIDSARQTLSANQKYLDELRGEPKEAGVPQWRILRSELDVAVAQLQLNSVAVQRSLLTVVAPSSGTVMKVQIAPGESTDPAVPAVEIVDLNRLVIAVDVPGFELWQIRIGQSASVDSAGAASEPITGTVSFIDSQIDPATGMGSVDISVPPGTALRPGQAVRMQIGVAEAQNAMTVPVESIVRNSDGKPAVAVVIRYGRWADLVPVEVGIREGDNVQISGQTLMPGQVVATGGAYALPDRTEIRVLRD
jgi:membrane fusion protein (multidrug efflux system)